MHDFGYALAALKAGRRVQRFGWASRWWSLRRDGVASYFVDQDGAPVLLEHADIVAHDWHVVPVLA